MSDPVADFLAITGCESEEAAIEYLSMADFVVSDAANLYLADKGRPTDRDSAPSRGRPIASDTTIDVGDVEALMAASRNDPTPPTASVTSSASPTHIATLTAPDPVFPPYPALSARPVDNPLRGAFDDVRGGPTDRLRDMFSLPPFVLEGENIQRVLSLALSRDLWVVVAIVNHDFRSACITRDIWRCSAMSAVAEYVVCAQFNVASVNGRECADMFRIDAGALPAMFMVDPFTQHRELRLTLKVKADSSYNGEAAVEDMLIFVGTRGRPQQSHSAALQESDESYIDVDGEDRDATEEASHVDSAPAEATGAVPTAASAPIAGVHPVTPVDVDAWALPADDKAAFKLRVRLPKSSLTLCLRSDTPVDTLARYLAYRAYVDDTTTYPTVPSIELRGGFPPKLLPLPEDATTPLGAWAGVRTGDALTVHIC